MNTEGFRNWLLACGLKTSTAESRVANCIIVELAQSVDLDVCYANDRCEHLIDMLTYSREDQRRNRAPRHSIPIAGDVYEGTATYKTAVKKYVAFKDSSGMVLGKPNSPKTVPQKVAAKSMVPDALKNKTGTGGEFTRILQDFRKWLEADADLKPDSADQYKTYINKLRSSVDEHFGSGWFESLPSEYLKDLSESKLIQCSFFIEDSIRKAPKSDRKAWNNWRSAFHSYVAFLHDIADVYNKDTETLRKEKAKGAPAKGKRKTAGAKRCKPDGVSPQAVIATYTHPKLTQAFMGRLKTQSRYYPKFNLLFPTRLLTKIFKRTKRPKSNIWVEWLKSDLKDMRILAVPFSDVGQLPFSDIRQLPFSVVRQFEFYDDGTVLITTNDGRLFVMMTHTVRNGIKKECAGRGLRDVSIDHAESLEKVLSKNKNKLKGLGFLTGLFFEFEKLVGHKLNPRVENDWLNNFYKQFQHVLDTDEMRARIADDLKMLDLKFELMDTIENSKKGKNG